MGGGTAGVHWYVYSAGKTAKNRACGQGFVTPHTGHRSVPERGWLRARGIEPKHCGYLKKICTFENKPYISRVMMKTYKDLIDSEYTVKDGRLINNAQPLEMGISKAARMRREVSRSKKVAKIAEGIEMAEARKDIRNMF